MELGKQTTIPPLPHQPDKRYKIKEKKAILGLQAYSLKPSHLVTLFPPHLQIPSQPPNLSFPPKPAKIKKLRISRLLTLCHPCLSFPPSPSTHPNITYPSAYSLNLQRREVKENWSIGLVSTQSFQPSHLLAFGSSPFPLNLLGLKI